jgi:hypothetical protein
MDGTGWMQDDAVESRIVADWINPERETVSLSMYQIDQSMNRG